MAVNDYLTEEERFALENVTIGICGAGGLGSNCAAHLVRAGVRKFVLADYDVVTESNLNRQFFFRDQIGEKKVFALATNLRRISEGLSLTLVDRRLSEADIPEVFASCDIIVEAVDRAETKARLIALVLKMGKRLVTASGMAGWGRSNLLKVRRMGTDVIVVGDAESEVSSTQPPQSPRVGIVAAQEANSVISMILGKEI